MKERETRRKSTGGDEREVTWQSDRMARTVCRLMTLLRKALFIYVYL